MYVLVGHASKRERAQQDVRMRWAPDGYDTDQSLIDQQYQQAEPPQRPTRRADCVPIIQGPHIFTSISLVSCPSLMRL